jgi:FkbM family methyltransferase
VTAPRPSPARILRKLGLKLGLAARVAAGFDDDLRRAGVRASFAQCGEDLIAWFVLQEFLGIARPGYVDVGAHHPTHLSNTALFHALGGRGINIEPDPGLFADFPRQRPGDVNLNLGIAPQAGTARFFLMADPTLNTFSAEEAARMERERGIAIRDVRELPVAPLSAVWERAPGPVDFLSVDVEGHDLAVLATLDLSRHRPAVICVETVDFVTGRKLPAVAEWLAPHDYGIWADTRINTLFVDRRRIPLP